MLGLLNVTHFVSSSGYVAIFVLSVLQSCCVPTSSELTFAFAGAFAASGKLSLPGAILVGASGELAGAYVAWFVGRYGGRGFVDRFGKYVLMTHRDLDRAEAWYDRHGNWGVFAGRLIPVIRNFVAIPAGVAEVPLLRFGILTALGSLVWDGAWAILGYNLHSSYHKITKGFSDAGYVLGAVAVVAIVFVIYHRYRSYKAQTGQSADDGPPRDEALGPPPKETQGPPQVEPLSRRRRP